MRKLRIVALSIAITIYILGCYGAVREDRTVEFSRDGQRVAFQNRDDGVFVASADGQGLTKIFQPDQNVLATSRPMSSPVDGRLIFTTAEPLENEPPQPPRDSGPLPAEGIIVWQRPVRYTCWIKDETHGDQQGEVKKLFEARCGHPGYVSGGLAVRWSPDGQHILYIAELADDSTQHSIFEFDIATGESRRVFPVAGHAVICDWTPAGSYLVCSVGNWPGSEAPQPPNETQCGIWIGRPSDEKSWWRVPESERFADGQLPSLIEMLRASRPVWTKDDSQFAFVSQTVSINPSETPLRRLNRVEMNGRKISTVTEGHGALSDVYWSPDGRTLGYVERDEIGRAMLIISGQDGTKTTVPTSESVRRFAGFDPSGQHLAYVVSSEPAAPIGANHWALLLPLSRERDSVRIAMASGSEAGQEIFSGMQVTFPLWSPTEERLSLWLTFVARYRSVLSIYGPAGLWPGDPAATIDLKTGAISWMAVSPQEELQVGHYSLLKGNAEEAWRWYVKARQKLPQPKPPGTWQELIQTLGAPERSQLFESICLMRLGRDAEAAEKWKEFESNFYPVPGNPAETPAPAVPVNPAAGLSESQIDPVMKALVRDLFIAEVFLSVDGLNEAIKEFQKPRALSDSEITQFTRTIVLAQLMLIAGDDAGYLNQCGEVVAPLALKLWQTELPGQPASEINPTLQLATGLCLVPLFRAEFLERFPLELLKKQLLVWKDLAMKHQSGRPALAIDLVLRAFAIRLNDVSGKDSAEKRITANPAAQQLLSGRPIDEWTGAIVESVNLAKTQ